MNKLAITIATGLIFMFPLFAFSAPPKHVLQLPVLLQSQEDCLPTLKDFVSSGAIKPGKWKPDGEKKWRYNMSAYDKSAKKMDNVSFLFEEVHTVDLNVVVLSQVSINGKYSSWEEVANLAEMIANSLESQKACLTQADNKKKMFEIQRKREMERLTPPLTEQMTKPAEKAATAEENSQVKGKIDCTLEKQLLWEMQNGTVFLLSDTLERGSLFTTAWLEIIYNREDRKGLGNAVRSRSKYSATCGHQKMTREVFVFYDDKGHVVDQLPRQDSELVVPGTFGADLYQRLCPKKSEDRKEYGAI